MQRSLKRRHKKQCGETFFSKCSTIIMNIFSFKSPRNFQVQQEFKHVLLSLKVGSQEAVKIKNIFLKLLNVYLLSSYLINLAFQIFTEFKKCI